MSVAIVQQNYYQGIDTSNSTSFSTTSPALTSTITAGNLLIMEVYSGSGYFGYGITCPSGWSTLVNNSNEGSNYYAQSSIFYKVATSTDVASGGIATVAMPCAYASNPHPYVFIIREFSGASPVGFTYASSPTNTSFTNAYPSMIGALGVFSFCDQSSSAMNPMPYPSGTTLFYDYNSTQNMSMSSGSYNTPVSSLSPVSPSFTAAHATSGLYAYLYWVPASGAFLVQERIADTSIASEAGTVTLNSPALTGTITAGNVLTLEVYAYHSTGYNYSIGTPSGWTSIFNNSSAAGSGGPPGSALFTKIATTTDVASGGVASVTFTATSFNATFYYSFVIREIANATPSISSNVSTSSASWTSITPPNVGSLPFISIVANASSVNPVTYPTNWTTDLASSGTFSGSAHGPTATSVSAISPSASSGNPGSSIHAYYYFVPMAPPAPVIVQTQTQTVTGTADYTGTPFYYNSPALPNIITAGNLLTLEVYDNTNIFSVSINAPSGWTQIYNNSANTSSGASYSALFVKVATSSDVASGGIVSVPFGPPSYAASNNFSYSFVTREIYKGSSSIYYATAGVSGDVFTWTTTPSAIGALPFISMVSDSNFLPITYPSGFTSDLSGAGVTAGSAHGTIALTTNPLTAVATSSGTPSSPYGYYYFVPYASATLYTRTVSDTNSASDSISRTYKGSRSTSDSNTESESLSRIYIAPRSGSDTNSASDNISRTYEAIRSLSDTNSESESIARLYIAPRTTSDTNTASDSITHQDLFNRTLADTNVANDNVSHTDYFFRTSTDTSTATDSVSASNAKSRSTSDSMSMSDTIVHTDYFYRSLSDTQDMSDSIARIYKALRSTADSNTESETISRLLAYYRNLSESLPEFENITSTYKGIRSTSDSNTESETIARSAILNRTAADTNVESESASRLYKSSRTPADTQDMSDSVSRNTGATRSASDTQSMSDSIMAQAGMRYRSAMDSITMSDSANVSHSGSINVGDTIASSDSISRTYKSARSASESDSMSDAIAAQYSYSRTPSDTRTASDSASRVYKASRNAADTAVNSDIISAYFKYLRSASDSNTASDSIAKVVKFARTLADNNLISESVHAQVLLIRLAQEMQSAVDTISRVVTNKRNAADTQTLVDNLQSFVNRLKIAADSITSSDSVSTGRLHIVNTQDSQMMTDAIVRSALMHLHVNEAVETCADVISRSYISNQFVQDTLEMFDSIAESYTRYIVPIIFRGGAILGALPLQAPMFNTLQLTAPLIDGSFTVKAPLISILELQAPIYSTLVIQAPMEGR